MPGAGSVLEPIRNSSIARAAPRPSLMAQTTSDWPRRQSPAAKTFGTFVANLPCSALKVSQLPRGRLRFDAEHFADGQLRAEEAGGQQHQIGGPELFAARHFLNGAFSPGFDQSTSTVLMPVTRPLPSSTNSLVRMLNSRGSWPNLAFDLGVRIVDAKDPRPLGPGIVRRPARPAGDRAARS